MAAWLERHQACLHLIVDAGDIPGDAESYYQELLVQWNDSLAALPPSLITSLAVHPPFGLPTAVSALTALTRLELAYTDSATDEEIGTLDLSISAHHLRPLMRLRRLGTAAVDMSGNADELLSVPKLAGLQALELRNCGLQASPPSLSSLTHLTALSLSENLLWICTSALASLAVLQRLQFGPQWLRPRGSAAAAVSTYSPHPLEAAWQQASSRLAEPATPDPAPRPGPGAVSALTGLTRLDLSWSHELDGGWQHLLPLAKLQDLNLSWCNLTAVQGQLSVLTALNRLDLSGSYWLANGWQHLLPLTQLLHLNLQCVMLPGGVEPPELAVLPQLCVALRMGEPPCATPAAHGRTPPLATARAATPSTPPTAADSLPAALLPIVGRMRSGRNGLYKMNHLLKSAELAGEAVRYETPTQGTMGRGKLAGGVIACADGCEHCLQPSGADAPRSPFKAFTAWEKHCGSGAKTPSTNIVLEKYNCSLKLLLEAVNNGLPPATGKTPPGAAPAAAAAAVAQGVTPSVSTASSQMPQVPKQRKIPGKLYPEVVLRELDPSADATTRICVAVTVGGNMSRSSVWTRGIPEGSDHDGLWRLHPLLEEAGGQSRLQVKPLPAKWRDSLAKACRVLDVELEVEDYKFGPGNTILLLRGLSPASRRGRGNYRSTADDLLRYQLPHSSNLVSVHEPLITELTRIWGSSSEAQTEEGRQAKQLAHDAAAEDAKAARLPDDGSEKDRMELAADKADELRHDLNNSASVLRFKEAVHTGSLKLLIAAIESSRQGGGAPDAESTLRSMCTPDSTEMKGALAAVCPHLGITHAHLMGEALELLTAHAFLQRDVVTIRNYLHKGANNTTTFVQCSVERCFISAAPKGSPFHMTDRDRDELRETLRTHVVNVKSNCTGQDEEREEIEKAANLLSQHMKKDCAFDVLVCLKEVDTPEACHFIVVQCKARSDFTAHVDVWRYVCHANDLQKQLKKLRILAPLLWCSNVFTNHAFKSRPDPTSSGELSRNITVATGKLVAWLLPDICADDKAEGLLDRVAKAAVEQLRGSDKQAARLPLEPPTLRPHQVRSCEELSNIRKKNLDDLDEGRGFCLTVSMATGAGKTILACEDVLRAEEEFRNSIGKKPSLCTAPRIDLVLQTAAEWLSWERRRKKTAGELPSLTARLRCFYYVVCSADEEDASSASLRVISVHKLVSTLERHRQRDELDQCRFFSTVEGAGAFWYKARRYNLRLGRRPQAPIFGAFVRDEVHKMCGVSTTPFALGLNVPALWLPSYTATPMAEVDRAKNINAAIKACGIRARSRTHSSEQQEPESTGEYFEASTDSDNEVDEQSADGAAEESEATAVGAGEEDEDSDDECPSRVARMHAAATDELFMQVYYDGKDYGKELAAVLEKDPALHSAAKKNGLHGLMLLSPSLLFRSLNTNSACALPGDDQAVFDDGSSPELTIGKLRECLLAIQSNRELMFTEDSTQSFFGELEKMLERPVACFYVTPSSKWPSEDKIKSDDSAGNTDDTAWPVADGDRSTEDEQRNYLELFDAEFDWGRRNFKPVYSHTLASGGKLRGEPLVLGLWHPEDSAWEFSLRVGPARGTVVHDSTSYLRNINLVGPILTSYSFAQCFRDNSLARPWLALSDNGVLRLPSHEVDRHQRSLRAWAGLSNEAAADDDDKVIVQDPRKFFFKLCASGSESVIGTAHDFHSMAHLLDLFTPIASVECGTGGPGSASGSSNGAGAIPGVQRGPVMKAIVFCTSNVMARRCLHIFKTLAKARKLDITAAHVYQSDVTLGTGGGSSGRGQTYERRQQLIWQFRSVERGVLFNVDLLSTGVDLPCCDCVYLHSPTKNSTVMLQRWGRALRKKDGKEWGTLAMPCTDPYVPDAEQREALRLLGTDKVDRDHRIQLYREFDFACRIAECALDPGNLVLGRLISVVAGWAPGGSGGGSSGRDMFGPPLLSLMISRRSEQPQLIVLRHSDLPLLAQINKAVGRPLKELEEPAMLVLLTQWRAGQPQTIKTTRLPRPKKKTNALGVWLSKLMSVAKGNAGSAAQHAAAKQLLNGEIKTILGHLDDDWWNVSRLAPLTLNDKLDCLGRLNDEGHLQSDCFPKPSDSWYERRTGPLEWMKRWASVKLSSQDRRHGGSITYNANDLHEAEVAIPRVSQLLGLPEFWWEKWARGCGCKTGCAAKRLGTGIDVQVPGQLSVLIALTRLDLCRNDWLAGGWHNLLPLIQLQDLDLSQCGQTAVRAALSTDRHHQLEPAWQQACKRLAASAAPNPIARPEAVQLQPRDSPRHVSVLIALTRLWLAFNNQLGGGWQHLLPLTQL
ncbi:hypothetical protein ACK3TF_004858 [Chlorella vulgaris]